MSKAREFYKLSKEAKFNVLNKQIQDAIQERVQSGFFDLTINFQEAEDIVHAHKIMKNLEYDGFKAEKRENSLYVNWEFSEEKIQEKPKQKKTKAKAKAKVKAKEKIKVKAKLI